MLIPFLIALSLNFDTFSVSVVEGAQARKAVLTESLKVAAVFGFVQGLFALVGALLGVGFRGFIASTDHWVAFILLSAIGAKMMKESFQKTSCESQLRHFDFRSILFLAVATSIDAFIVGITLAFLKDSTMIYVFVIGLITFGASLIGYHCGKAFKKICGSEIKIIGGLILIAIGIKTLIQHLFLGG